MAPTHTGPPDPGAPGSRASSSRAASTSPTAAIVWMFAAASRVGVEQPLAPRPPGRIVVAVVQTRESEELVGERVVVGDRLTDRLLVRRARVVASTSSRCALSFASSRKPNRRATTSRASARVNAASSGEPGCAHQARVELVDDLGSAGVAGADCPLERLRAVLQLLEIGIAGKTAGWHKGLLFTPGVRNLEAGKETPTKHRQDSGGLRPLRGPVAPCAPTDHTSAQRVRQPRTPRVRCSVAGSASRASIPSAAPRRTRTVDASVQRGRLLVVGSRLTRSGLTRAAKEDGMRVR